MTTAMTTTTSIRTTTSIQHQAPPAQDQSCQKQSDDDADGSAETIPYDGHDVENLLAAGLLTDHRQLLE